MRRLEACGVVCGFRRTPDDPATRNASEDFSGGFLMRLNSCAGPNDDARRTRAGALARRTSELRGSRTHVRMMTTENSCSLEARSDG